MKSEQQKPIVRLKDTYQARMKSGDVTCDDGQLAAIAHLEKIQRALETADLRNAHPLSRLFRANPKSKAHGLYIWGGVGAGKSMIMDLFFETTGIKQKRRVHFHEFMQEIHKTIFETRQMSVGDPIKTVSGNVARQVKLLCFDELQIGDITDAMIVGRLFEQLFEAGVTIVSTSNRRPDDLYKDGLNRQLFLPFIKLIKSRMTVHHLITDTDYRQDKIRGQQIYFCPNDVGARIKIDRIWRDLSDGQGGPLTLKVNKRNVTLPLYHNGLARASFEDLCARPLGAADYLAITKSIRLLVLEDIPRLSRANNNEAKRFVTLIDTLYEAQVQLIASAATPPESLYQSGAGSFEFERTASRLREMQSADWAR